MNKLYFPLIVFLTIVAVSCSNNDQPEIPINAIRLNMMIGDDDSTIGGSDVYISNSCNFISDNCAIADLGDRGGLNQNPNPSQIAKEVAVTPGNFYQIILAGDIRTVAGVRAIPINANYYNVFVDSWIYDKESNIIGTQVSYAECSPEISQLPKWNDIIDIKLGSKNGNYLETAEYSFPKGCKIDDNIELHDFEYSQMAEHLDIEVRDNTIIFSNPAWTPGGKVEVILRVRYENTYTRILLNVESGL